MPTVFLLRAATPKDNESIQRVYRDSVAPRAGQQRDLGRLVREGSVVVAEVNGQVVGFGGIDVNALEHLKWLYVLPEHQNAGIGSQLLKELEEICSSRGLRAIRLHSAPASVEFYRRHGYSPVEEHEAPVHDHDGLEMIKDCT